MPHAGRKRNDKPPEPMKTRFAKPRLPIFPCLLALLAAGIGSCTKDRQPAPRRFLPGTSDVLYVDGVRYLLDRSPLCSRRGYDKLFSRFSYTEVFPGVPGLTGPPDKLYSAVWVLSGDSLLLVGLDYPRTEVLRRSVRSLPMPAPPSKSGSAGRSVPSTKGRCATICRSVSFRRAPSMPTGRPVSFTANGPSSRATKTSGDGSPPRSKE